jgi:hypothetical protein
MSTFEDYGQALTYAAIKGLDIDPQDNYCEACRAYHVGEDHEQAVLVECGEVGIQGFTTILECNRPPHEDTEHRTDTGTTWRGGTE